MVRPVIQTLAPAPSEKLGDLVEWFDKAGDLMEQQVPITGEERAFVDSLYFEAAERWAETQGVPVGFVIGSVAEMVRQKIVERTRG